jgi:hypothetical protein
MRLYAVPDDAFEQNYPEEMPPDMEELPQELDQPIAIAEDDKEEEE